jgi:hypothetical protein
MNKHWQAVIVAAALLVGWSSPAVAKQGHGRGHGKDKGHSAKAKDAARTNTSGSDKRDRRSPIGDQTVVIDRDGHRRIVTEYFSRESLPPGLAKRQSLPPGLAKQLRERGHLPPGLQKRLVPVPAPLASRLPGIPRPYRRYFAGHDLIVVDPRTNTIVALIPDVGR